MADPRLHPNYAKSKPLTAERLRDLLVYYPETGFFKWRDLPGEYNRKGGARLTPGHRYGRYLGLGIDYRRYYCHRLAWLWVHGVWPEHGIDHINGDTYDNRLSNLRAATGSQNNYNQRRNSRNTSGYKGVSFYSKTGQWRAAINVGKRKRKHLGLYDTPEEAAVVYRQAAADLYGVFARFD